MTAFAIAGIRMHVAAVHDNVGHIKHRLDLLMTRFPRVRMVLFSELAAFAVAFEVYDGPAETAERA